MPEYISNKETSLFNFTKEYSFGLSYARYAGYIKQNKIKVNNKKPSLNDKVIKGDIINLYFNPQSPTVPIVYNDGELLIVNKPQGLPSVGDYYYTAEKIIYEMYPTAKLCHRLDTGTSGLLMFALTNAVYDFILTGQKEQSFNKFYRAMVVSKVTKNDVTYLTHHLVKNKTESLVRIYDKPNQGSQPCKLGYRVIRSNSELSLLEVQLFTGRTHQIRAQLDHVGLPILGDDKYGNRDKNKHYKIYWPILQAYKLDFSSIKGDYTFCGKVITIDEPEYISKYL